MILGSAGKKFGDVLPKQRALTDASLKALESYVVMMSLSKFSKELQDEIAKLQDDAKNLYGTWSN